MGASAQPARVRFPMRGFMLSKSCFFFIKTIKINSISSHKAAFVQRIPHENWAEIERREWWYSCWGALIYSLQELQKPGGLRWRQLKSEMMHRRRKIKTFYISVCDSTSLSVFKGFLTAGRVHRRAQMLVITRARCSGVLENSSLYPHKEHERTESHLSCRQGRELQTFTQRKTSELTSLSLLEFLCF